MRHLQIPGFARRIGIPVSLLLFVLATGTAPTSDGGESGASAGSLSLDAAPANHARARILFEQQQLRRGATNWLAVQFEIDPGWHLYWNGRNDSGLPPDVTPALPKGYRLGAPLWPVPERMLSPGPILDHVYEGSFTLLYPLEVPKTAASDATLGFAVSWLACQEMCIPESDSLAIAVKVGDEASTPTDAALFREARAALPEHPDTRPYSIQWSAKLDTATVKLELPDPHAASGTGEVAGLAFFPDTQCSEVVDASTTTLAQGRSLSIRLIKEKGKARLSGILQVRAKRSAARAYSIDESSR